MKVEAGSVWIRKRLVRGERRIALVLSVGHWGGGTVEYRYTRPLADGYGKGVGKMRPSVNAVVMGEHAFLREFDPRTLSSALREDDSDAGGYVL